jgi:hypothetical protein
MTIQFIKSASSVAVLGAGVRLDCLGPATFRYKILAHEILI